VQIAKILIRAGADVNARDSNGRGPLYHAVIAGYRELTDILIANMASVFAFDFQGN
jgi:ankyrin repeat protein